MSTWFAGSSTRWLLQERESDDASLISLLSSCEMSQRVLLQHLLASTQKHKMYCRRVEQSVPKLAPALQTSVHQAD